MFYPKFLTCEKALPIPQEVLDAFPDRKWNEIDFIFFAYLSYGDDLDKYEISEDGSIYQRGESGEITKREITNELNFSTLLIGEGYDFFLSFKALFFKGELKELSLNEFKKTENRERKERDKKNIERMLISMKRAQKIHYKIFILYRGLIIWIFKWIFRAFDLFGDVLTRFGRWLCLDFK